MSVFPAVFYQNCHQNMLAKWYLKLHLFPIMQIETFTYNITKFSKLRINKVILSNAKGLPPYRQKYLSKGTTGRERLIRTRLIRSST